MNKRQQLTDATIYGNVDGEVGFVGTRIEGNARRVQTYYAKVPSMVNGEDDYVKVTIKLEKHDLADESEYTTALERAYTLATENLGTAADRSNAISGTLAGTFTDLP